MEFPEKPSSAKNKNSRNMLLAVMAGQVGFITLALVIGAVVGGLALDNLLGTKPWFTIGLLIASVPVSIFVMVLIARKTVAKINTDETKNLDRKEDKIGKDS
jgi:F0F1-type ATP synthase assembly protein I